MSCNPDCVQWPFPSNKIVTFKNAEWLITLENLRVVPHKTAEKPHDSFDKCCISLHHNLCELKIKL